MSYDIKAVIFDFGGVIAEEGFRNGTREIGRMNGLDPEGVFTTAERTIIESGYLTGRANEAAFWNVFRRQTGISSPDSSLREEILKRFILRPVMIEMVDRIRAGGVSVAMLSDQTNWLEEIDAKSSLFRHFDNVFNSYRTHMSKQDPSVFTYVCASLGIVPSKSLFVDDNIGHVERARSRGLHTVHFTTVADFQRQISGNLAMIYGARRSPRLHPRQQTEIKD